MEETQDDGHAESAPWEDGHRLRRAHGGGLLTWQCGAQEAWHGRWPQAICGLGSRNGGSLIQAFFLSL